MSDDGPKVVPGAFALERECAARHERVDSALDAEVKRRQDLGERVGIMRDRLLVLAGEDGKSGRIADMATDIQDLKDLHKELAQRAVVNEERARDAELSSAHHRGKVVVFMAIAAALGAAIAGVGAKLLFGG